MTGKSLLAYYVLAFLLEDDLFNALRQGGLNLIWKSSKLLSMEFCLLYYPIIVYFWAIWLPTTGEELWQVCMGERSCRQYLRRSPWGWLHNDPRFASIDLADIQWREFRGALPLLSAAVLGLALLVRLCVWTFGPSRGTLVRLLVGVGFMAYVHGMGMVFPLVLVFAFFLTARATAGTHAAVPACWALALLAIVAKEPQWPLRRHLSFGRILGRSWGWLDAPGYQGEYDWAQSINLLVLRLLSYALDCHALVLKHRREGSEDEDGGHKQVLRRYSLHNGLSHAFYAPVVLAGPTICFDDYVEQSTGANPTRSSQTHLGWYVVRLLLALLAMEAGLHAFPCFALARSGRLGQLGPRLGAAAVFLTLNLMWLKFLLLWRIARAWALAEGIDIPENMKRALCDHYSVVGFWRCWHSSFNRWLVRYIYVPAGGRDRKVLATALTFAFVALWHDAEAKLMAWGALNSLFLACETVVTSAWQSRTGHLSAQYPWLHRQVGALGGTTYIMVLMAVNMIGYSVGIGGISGLLVTAASTGKEALQTMLGAYAVLFSGVQVMLEIRKLDGTWAPRAPAVTPACQMAQREDASKQE